MVICAGLCIAAIAGVVVVGIGAAGAVAVAAETKKANKYTNNVDLSNHIQHIITKEITSHESATSTSTSSSNELAEINVGGNADFNVSHSCPENLSAGTIDQKAAVIARAKSMVDVTEYKQIGLNISNKLTESGDVVSGVGSGGLSSLLSNEERSNDIDGGNSETDVGNTKITDIITAESSALASSNAEGAIAIMGNFKLTCDKEDPDIEKKKLENQNELNLKITTWLLNHYKNPNSNTGGILRYAGSYNGELLSGLDPDILLGKNTPSVHTDPRIGIGTDTAALRNNRVSGWFYKVNPATDADPTQDDLFKDSNDGKWVKIDDTNQMNVEDFKNKFKNRRFEKSTKLFSIYQDVLVKSLASSSATKISNMFLHDRSNITMDETRAVTATNDGGGNLKWCIGIIVGVLILGIVLWVIGKKLNAQKATPTPSSVDAPPVVAATDLVNGPAQPGGGKSQSNTFLVNIMKPIQSITKKPSIYKIICAIIILFLFFKNNFRKL